MECRGQTPGTFCAPSCHTGCGSWQHQGTCHSNNFSMMQLLESCICLPRNRLRLQEVFNCELPERLSILLGGLPEGDAGLGKLVTLLLSHVYSLMPICAWFSTRVYFHSLHERWYVCARARVKENSVLWRPSLEEACVKLLYVASSAAS